MNDFSWEFLNNHKIINWKGFCHKDRNTAIYEIEGLVNKYGFITDFHMFSDIEICLSIEIEEKKTDQLYTALKEIIELNEKEEITQNSTKERIILLNITFSRGSGNLKIEVPTLPG